MGIVFHLSGPKKQREDEIRELAQTLGLRFSRSTSKEGPRLRGFLEGHKVTVRTARLKECRIEVEFDAGVGNFSIYDRAANLRTNNVDASTEDEHFDASFRLLLPPNATSATVLDYLNPHRRTIVHALGGAFDSVKIKEDGFEVRMAADPGIDQLCAALEECVFAAKALDKAARSQDALRVAA